MSVRVTAPRPEQMSFGNGGWNGGARLLLASASVGLIATMICLVGFFLSPDQMLYSYLTSYIYFFGLSFGALAWLMTFHAANSRWIVVVRRPLELLASLMPLWALLFIPVLVGMKRLYPWVVPNPVRGDHFLLLVRHQAGYLNVPGFIVRAIVYFILWSALGHFLYRNSLAQDGVPETERTLQLTRRSRRVSSVGLPLSGIAITFAGFDWLMSLDPEFRSTVFSLYYFAGDFVSAMALLIVIVYLFDRAGLLASEARTRAAINAGVAPAVVGRLVSTHHYHTLGKLLFAFVCFWAYIAFSQYMLIWIADLPESEIPFYLLRQRQGWTAVSLLLVFGHFFLPFLYLLPVRPKKSPARLAAAAVWILFVHWVDSFWLVQPFFDRTPLLHWQDCAAFFALGGAGLSLWLVRQRGRQLVPVGDPYFEDSVVFEK